MKSKPWAVKLALTIAAMALALAILAPAARAATLYVKADATGANSGTSWTNAYKDLQKALTAAAWGDEIWVAAGTYKPTTGTDRTISFAMTAGVGIYGGFAGTETARSQHDWSTNATILSGDIGTSGTATDNSYHIVLGANSAVLDGFTITGGYSSGHSSEHGGGMVNDFVSSSTIANCTFTNNTASGTTYGYGGGMYNFNASQTVINCTFTNNTASATSYGYGGGLYLEGLYLDKSSPSVRGNTIKGNSASSYGGGIYIINSNATVANNTITSNSALAGGGLYLSQSSPTITNNTIAFNHSQRGGGLYLDFSSPVIASNSIISNTASSWGGGLGVGLDCSPNIANNTIMANSAGKGGGLWLNGSRSSPTIANTVIAFNSSGIVWEDDSYRPTLQHNCVYGNRDYDYSGLDDPTGTDGNISKDPKFASAEYGNWHIQPDSPCVDAGDNTYAHGDYDVDGQPRIQPSGGTVDIGADESDGTSWNEQHVIVRVSPAGDDANDGSSWASAKRTVQAAIEAALVAGGGEVWVKGGTYYERIVLRNFVYLFGGFAGDETERSQRDWGSHMTILDGDGQGSVVTCQESGFNLNRLDGFTITNGSAEYGGGIYLEYSSPMLTNNTIVGNSAYQGGGIYLSKSCATVTSDTISANNADNRGGGCYQIYSSPMVTNNTIAANYAYIGGGLYLTDNTAITSYMSSPRIVNNKIMDNCAAYRGGGLFLEESSPIIANNTITANIAPSGGGLYLGWYCSPNIANNTITANSAPSGGGLWFDGYQSFPTISNTIVAFNSSGVSWGNDYHLPVLQHNCVYGNRDYDYSGLDDPTGTDGNIYADPKFASAKYGNWHLQPDSPCVDAGNNAYAHGDYDVDGQPRIQPSGGTVDIGADESDGTSWNEQHAIVRVSPEGDDANDGSSWASAKCTVQAAITAAAAAGGGEAWVKGGAYHERIVLRNFVYLFGGFAGDETERLQRNWGSHVTILDGEKKGSVVTSQDPGFNLSRLDGFTIINGSATYGGGLELLCASPTIANNTLMSNTATTGGGLDLLLSCSTITSNTITDNSAPCGGGINVEESCPYMSNNVITGNNASYSGGGVQMCSSSGTLSNNTITDNSAPYGGGLYLNFSSPSLINNEIMRNSATESGGVYLDEAYGTLMNDNMITDNNASSLGGGVGMWWCNPTLRGNTIMRNTAGGPGGGLYLRIGNQYPTLMNNIIAGNNASGTGGGLYIHAGSSTFTNNIVVGNYANESGGGLSIFAHAATFVNNTISDNYAPASGGLFLDGSSTSLTLVNTIVTFNTSGVCLNAGSLALRHNCIYGNSDYNYSGLDNPTGTDGNLSDDPKFVRNPDPGSDEAWGTVDDDYGDLRLQFGSLCIDAGTATGAPTADILGKARVGLPDIGVYEYQPPPTPESIKRYLLGLDSDPTGLDFNGDGKVDIADLVRYLINHSPAK